MHASVMQSLVAERNKAFRAQAFSLKQLNTRVIQLQHQQTEQASREAALLQELSLGSIEGQSSTAESLVAASEHGSMSTLKRVQSRLPLGMETMRRRLEPIMSSGELSESCESGQLFRTAGGPRTSASSLLHHAAGSCILVTIMMAVLNRWNTRVQTSL